MALDEIRHSGNQNRGGNVTRVAAALAALRAHNIAASVQRVLDMLRRTNHVHHSDAGLVQLVDRPARWHADSRHKQRCARLNDNIDQLRQLALCVILSQTH